MSKSLLKVGIVGGAGYTGGELIRILLRHPDVELSDIQSRSSAGKLVSDVHSDLLGDTDLRFTAELSNQPEVVFLCMGHGESRKFIEGHAVPAGTRIIDLSQDYRLNEDGQRPTINGEPVLYGLPEWNRDSIKKAKHIANPGCFATAIQLGLLPLAKEGWLEESYTTGITGSTGAGQSLQATTQFSWRADNVSAYKTLTHQHLREIRQTLKALNPLVEPPLHFVPWRGNFTRGIFVSSTVTCATPVEEVKKVYRRYYDGHPFTHLSERPIDLKQVVQTNKCLIQLEQAGDKLVVHTAIDNLVKGASGQAVQNMNLLFGFNEKAGLDLKAGSF